MIRPVDRARVLRECAVDLIRASDLVDLADPTVLRIQAHRLWRVRRDIEEIEAGLRLRIRILEHQAEAA